MIIDLTGQRFGLLTVLSIQPRTKANDDRWLCKCDCGNYKVKFSYTLRNQKSPSCGCITGELIRKSKYTHQDINSKEYRAWGHMKSRCYNKLVERYKDYGGRGITVCAEWFDSYENFLEDMGRCPHKDWTLDRIDPDGNYTKSNCRWATQLIQANNKTDNRYLEHEGVKMSLSDWARELNINRKSLSRLLDVHKFTLKEVIGGKRGKTWQKLITFNGETLNIKQSSEKLQMSNANFTRSEYKSMPNEKVVEIFYKRNQARTGKINKSTN